MKLRDKVLTEIIPDIESCEAKTLPNNNVVSAYELRASPLLTDNLIGSIGVLFIRGLLNLLGINEHHIFNWRMENKFIQYVVLNYYNNGCLPLTISLSDLLNEKGSLLQIQGLLNNAFFLKATLSERTGFTKTFDRTKEFPVIMKMLEKCEAPQYEKWVLQKKLNIKNEFRVHTFNGEIIPALSFLVAGVDMSYNEVNCFVDKILHALPKSILQGSLIAWDIALTTDDCFLIIEANFTGFHPDFKRGYQTSGYFQDQIYGPIICAWFNTYIKMRYNVWINRVEDSLFKASTFYQAFMYYVNVFQDSHVKAFLKKNQHQELYVFLYMCTSDSMSIINLVAHFDKVQFANKYYVILQDAENKFVSNIFNGKPYIQFILEEELFTKDQLSLIKQLHYVRRKQIGYRHMLRQLPTEHYIMF
jgi:hypothetical protein